MERGSAITRPPRLALDANETAEIEAMMKLALATRPQLPEVGVGRTREYSCVPQSGPLQPVNHIARSHWATNVITLRVIASILLEYT